jgi:hypothetical protein
VTTLHNFGGVVGRPLDNFIVTALGSCVKVALSFVIGAVVFVVAEKFWLWVLPECVRKAK